MSEKNSNNKPLIYLRSADRFMKSRSFRNPSLGLRDLPPLNETSN